MIDDPRIDAFLAAVRRDLGEFFSPCEAEERVREIAAHLQQAVADHAAAGAEDPVAAALADFGDPKGYREAARPRLVRRPERAVLAALLLVLLVPIGADLLMDASSWLTGSDSALYALGIPVTLILAFRFALASGRCRRFMPLHVAAITLACFAAFLALGGWTRSTDPGGLGTRTRGTAFRRRESLVRITLPEKETRLAQVQRAIILFAERKPTLGIGEFRAPAGYLVPTIPAEWRANWKGDPRAPRWLLDDLHFEPVKDYAAARANWLANGPEIHRLAQSGVDGERQEIAELARVVACPWSVSVAADFESKAAMLFVTLPCLLLLHGLGFTAGALLRRRSQRGVA